VLAIFEMLINLTRLFLIRVLFHSVFLDYFFSHYYYYFAFWHKANNCVKRSAFVVVIIVIVVEAVVVVVVGRSFMNGRWSSLLGLSPV